VTREGIDYAWHHEVDAGAFLRSGVTFVVRYLSNDASKSLGAAEARLLCAAGLDLVVVWESSARRALTGRAAGAADARRAAAQAHACGMPARRPVYFAADFDASDAELPRVAEYLRGAAVAIGAARIGVYGGYRVVNHCLDARVARFAWQTSAWSNGRRDARAQLYQHGYGAVVGGIACDRDTAYAADFGQWRLREQPVEPAGEADAARDGSDRRERAGDVRLGALAGVVTEREALAARGEDHLGRDGEAREP
jgi:hypothetical protein